MRIRWLELVDISFIFSLFGKQCSFIIYIVYESLLSLMNSFALDVWIVDYKSW